MGIDTWVLSRTLKFVPVAAFIAFLMLGSKQKTIEAGELRNVEFVSTRIYRRFVTVITLTRLDETDDGLFGHLTMRGFDCITLENSETAIPTGSYKIGVVYSAHLGYNVLTVQGVPNRSSITIHKGNFPSDSRGCLILGTKRKGGTVIGSEEAFNQLFCLVSKALNSGGEVWITII